MNQQLFYREVNISLASLLTDSVISTYESTIRTWTGQQRDDFEYLYAPEVDALTLKIFRSYDIETGQLILDAAPTIIQTLFVHRAKTALRLYRDPNFEPVWGDILLAYSLLVDWHLKYPKHPS